MIALKGTPTAFVTLSSADCYWPDMEKYLNRLVCNCILYLYVVSKKSQLYRHLMKHLTKHMTEEENF